MRVEVLDGLERRRRWSQDDKTRIVEETLVPGAKVKTDSSVDLALVLANNNNQC
jgi:transposase-like protein